MARVRSPNYPSLSLPEAIDLIGKVFAAAKRNTLSKEAVVKALGYGGINGASLGALSALAKYGLLERDGNQHRVTIRAMGILHPRTKMERQESVLLAGKAPALFRDIIHDFPSGLPSDDRLRAYLARRGFSKRALAGVINSFRETMAFVSSEGMGYYPDPSVDDDDTPAPPDDMPRSTPEEAFGSLTYVTPARPPAPRMRVSVTERGIEVSAVLLDREGVDRLIAALNTMRPLLPAAQAAVNAADATSGAGQDPRHGAAPE